MQKIRHFAADDPVHRSRWQVSDRDVEGGGEGLAHGSGKRAVLEARLAEAGYDADALNAGAFMEAQVPLATIDRFLCSARGQLNATLKEIGVRREFAERARKAFDERLKLTVETPKPKEIGPN